MILSVSLNPCIDKTIFIRSLQVGGHNKADHLCSDVGGKGINVNSALHNLGAESRALGFEFTQSGTPVNDFLQSISVPFQSVRVDAPLRVNTKIFDLSSSEMTEINCSGAQVSPSDEMALMEAFSAALEGTDILVVTGSVPPGIRTDIYFRMISAAKVKGIYTVLDASGALLKASLPAGPDLVKPNKAELEQLLGREISSLPDAARACREVLSLGVGAVCLSLGGDGCMLVSPGGVWFSEGIAIDVRSFQGAGDSVVAGMCLAKELGLPESEMLRYGVAAAHGSLLREGTLLCTRESFDALLPQIPVTDYSSEY